MRYYGDNKEQRYIYQMMQIMLAYLTDKKYICAPIILQAIWTVDKA